ncbi:MAG: SURF1 family protein [Alphaproteobacteria bacterium]|nr:SURF1 family protein [Alphaproteobacteria bacterium]
MGFNFSRNPWLTVCTAGALLVLLALGTWQVQRLFWKEALIATAEARLKEEPTALPEGADGAALEYRRINVTGSFAHEKEIHLGVRYRKGVVGYAILTPMKLADGRWLLVNRGWVPPEKRDPETRKETQLPGEVSLAVMIRAPKKKGYFVPENNLAKNYWFYVDMAQAREFTGLELLPF